MLPHQEIRQRSLDMALRVENRAPGRTLKIAGQFAAFIQDGSQPATVRPGGSVIGELVVNVTADTSEAQRELRRFAAVLEDEQRRRRRRGLG